MISSRQVVEEDRTDIAQALVRDRFHAGITTDVFYKPGTISNIYEDAEGPVFVLRASKSLRIDMMFFSSKDSKRNAAAMIAGWEKLAESAKAAGFTEVTTSSNSPLLVRFAEKFLGFEKVQVGNEVALRRLL